MPAPQTADRPGGGDFAVELGNVQLTLGMEGGRKVRASVDSLVARSGEKLALTGPSGCGKSTLLNIVAGLLAAGSGSIRVLGEDLSRLSIPALDDFRGRHIGFIWQSFNLLESFSATENVLIGMRFGRWGNARTRRDRAGELLNRVGLSNRRSSRPGTLSIGERQRVAIARALASQPRLLLADEPTGALDPRTADEVFELLVEVCAENGCTLLMVTHDLALAGRLDRQFDCRGIIHNES
jgi:putative ABC transport system ATP-binding protein